MNCNNLNSQQFKKIYLLCYLYRQNISKKWSYDENDFLLVVSEEEAKVAEIKETVAEKQRRCDEDLAKAEPAVRQAEAALDTLNKVKKK